MTIDRRAFLGTLGAGLVAPAILLGEIRPKRYPIAFPTLCCPGWDWRTVLNQAESLGYTGIELRGVQGNMDLPNVPELAGSRLPDARREVASRGVVITDLGGSAHMHEKDPAAREKQFDDARRFIDLAHGLGVQYVRMFGNEIPKGEPREDVLK